MKSMKYFGYALCAAAVAFASCTPNPVEEEKKLQLAADRTEITADGTEKVTFTVKFGNEDVTASAEIRNAATEQAIEGNVFSTDTPGDYEFVASYDGKESDKVTVKAVPVSGLLLSVDKESIVNNGEDAATFTVSFEGKDVTASSVIVDLTNGQRWNQGERVFVSRTSGEYEFKASYDGMSSNTVGVAVGAEALNPLVLTATKPRIAADGTDATSFVVNYEGADVTAQAKIKNLSTGEYLEADTFSYSGDLEVVEFQAEYEGAVSNPINIGFGAFYKNVLLFRFTGTWCGPCTAFSSVLSAALESYPDRTVQVAIHKNDAYTPNSYGQFASYFAEAAVPAIYLDFDANGPGAATAGMTAANVVETQELRDSGSQGGYRDGCDCRCRASGDRAGARNAECYGFLSVGRHAARRRHRRSSEWYQQIHSRQYAACTGYPDGRRRAGRGGREYRGRAGVYFQPAGIHG